MNLFKSLAAAVRGHGNNLGEAIVDANADTILDQQVRDVDNEIRQSKLDIAKLDAQRKGLSREVEALNEKREAGKAKAAKLIEAGQEDKAREIISLVKSEVMTSLTPKETQLASIEAALVKLRAGLAKAKQNKETFASRVAIAKTQKQVNKMTEAANASTVSSATASSQMEATLDRFEKKNSNKADLLDSLEDMDEDKNSLDALLADDSDSSKSAADMLNDI